ncbi:hypothetical protein ACHAXS_005769 [Conticribra weissflogii]
MSSNLMLMMPLAFCHWLPVPPLFDSQNNFILLNNDAAYVACNQSPLICFPINRRQNGSVMVADRKRKLGTILFSAKDDVEDGGNFQKNYEPNEVTEFFTLMSPSPSAKPDQMSASSLAYLGDVLFELFIRSRYVWPSRRMSDLQIKVVSIVRAEAQSEILRRLIDSYPLTSHEQGVLARGRNANLTARKKGKTISSGGGASVYQDSTALEALLGYVYISDKDRFNNMMQWMKDEIDRIDSC